MRPDDDVTTLPLDLVVHAGRRDRFSPTLADDCVSPPSSSPHSSPAATSDTGIETGSDVSSSCGDAAYRLALSVVPASTSTTALQLGYERLQLNGHPDVKSEPDSAYRPAYELHQQVLATSGTMTPRLTQSFQPSSAGVRSSFQCGVTVGYTYEAFVATDGRSRRRRPGVPVLSDQGPRAVGQDSRLSGRYTCCECGRHYATSSNLSRHKQTHRSLDSRYARACPHCHKPYVSMPALAMHILTHDLKLVASSATCQSSSSSSSSSQGLN